jgi:hypothetical protein
VPVHDIYAYLKTPFYIPRFSIAYFRCSMYKYTWIFTMLMGFALFTLFFLYSLCIIYIVFSICIYRYTMYIKRCKMCIYICIYVSLGKNIK